MDASDISIVAVLMQLDRPAENLSNIITASKRNYTIHEREFLAIFLACKRWRYYLHGAQTIVFTEYEPLTHIFTQPALNSKQVRQIECMDQLDLNIQHNTGKSNIAANDLSRILITPQDDQHDVTTPEVQE